MSLGILPYGWPDFEARHGPAHYILELGAGNFSFALALVRRLRGSERRRLEGVTPMKKQHFPLLYFLS